MIDLIEASINWRVPIFAISIYIYIDINLVKKQSFHSSRQTRDETKSVERFGFERSM